MTVGCLVKVKSTLTEDVVVGGYTRGSGARARTFGSLLVGSYSGADGQNAERHGHGFDGWTFADWLDRLERFARTRRPSMGPCHHGRWTRSDGWPVCVRAGHRGEGRRAALMGRRPACARLPTRARRQAADRCPGRGRSARTLVTDRRACVGHRDRSRASAGAVEAPRRSPDGRRERARGSVQQSDQGALAPPQERPRAD